MEYTFIKSDISTAKIKLYSELLTNVFPKSNKFSTAYLYWQYGLNPLGKIVGYDAFYGKKLVAHYATIPVNYEIDGKVQKGLLSLNTATAAAHRGKGLFTKLALHTYEEAVNLNYNFVIGVANANSTYGFINKLDFNLIAPLEVKLSIGSVTYNKNASYSLKPHWSDACIQWRLAKPECNYRLYKNNIYTSTNKPFINILMAQDCNGIKNIEQKNVHLTLWMGLANSLRSTCPFINIPKLLKPSPLNLIYKDLSRECNTFSKESVLFEPIDFDAY